MIFFLASIAKQSKLCYALSLILNHFGSQFFFFLFSINRTNLYSFRIGFGMCKSRVCCSEKTSKLYVFIFVVSIVIVNKRNVNSNFFQQQKKLEALF
jgi:hypothetical protein